MRSTEKPGGRKSTPTNDHTHSRTPFLRVTFRPERLPQQLLSWTMQCSGGNPTYEMAGNGPFASNRQSLAFRQAAFDQSSDEEK